MCYTGGMAVELLADIAVGAAGADAVFTYRVPPPLRAAMRIGQLVWAPLRRRRVQGIVVDLYAWGDDAESGPESFNPPDPLLDPAAHNDPRAPVLRDLLDVADPEAALTPAQIRLARWLASHYRTALYEALALMLPPGVTQEAEATWRATSAGQDTDPGALPAGERDVLYLLRRSGELTERELRRRLRGSDAELQAIYAALRERGLIVRGTSVSRARARPRIERMVRLAASPADTRAVLASLARAPRQRALVAYLLERAADQPAAIPLADALAATGADHATLRALERRGLVELSTREVRRDPLAGAVTPPDTPPPLSLAQERAWNAIRVTLDRLAAPASHTDTPGTDSPVPPAHFLLHGVTGSGKTEVYLRAIARALRLGHQALVLVPEIALTAQLVRRFAARFPGLLAVLHSELSPGERYDEWRRLRRGEARVAIGSRSAVFAPLPDLGLIIVDEEHEPSYKHDAAPRYHARDVARRLATLTGSTLILGSATPSVESYAAARAGRLALLELPERITAATGADGLPHTRTLPLPQVTVVDMRRELEAGNRSIFSRALQEALAGALARNEQAILFLNRRGAASFFMCRDCGYVVACPNCSSPLTLHHADRGASEQPPDGQRSPDRPPLPASGLLVCHTCNHRELPPAICPQCWSARIRSFGIGTQRVVEEMQALFPQARSLRWDRDSIGRKGDHERLLDRFLHGEADILVGTQMIAKGLDLPMVAVVGVVTADTGLNLPDFRAGERAFQLLTQVAGRAGRREAGARVVVQTYAPDHYAIRAAQEHDYAAFYQQEIAFRQQTGYPPFSRLVRFVYAAGSEARARRAAEALAGEVRRLATLRLPEGWGMIGPAPAFFHVQRGRYRWHLLLRAADPTPVLDALRLPPGWAMDIDPVQVL